MHLALTRLSVETIENEAVISFYANGRLIVVFIVIVMIVCAVRKP